MIKIDTYILYNSFHFVFSYITYILFFIPEKIYRKNKNIKKNIKYKRYKKMKIKKVISNKNVGK